MGRSATLNVWWQETRPLFFTASVVPVFLGTAIAWARNGVFHWNFFLLAIAGGVFLHGAANTLNDYFDHKSGSDDINPEFGRPFTGGSRVIQQGLMSPRAVLTESLVLFALATGVGIVLLYFRGAVIVWLGLAGGLSSVLYRALPRPLTYIGLGELAVGLNFGTLMTLGAYYVQTGSLAVEPALASIPVALLIAGVLYINQFQDYKADMAVGKNNLVVRLGRQRAAVGYWAIIVATYASLFIMAAAQVVSPFVLIAAVTAPIALKALLTVRKHHDSPLLLTPANAATVNMHLLVGLLLAAAYLVQSGFG